MIIPTDYTSIGIKDLKCISPVTSFNKINANIFFVYLGNYLQFPAFFKGRQVAGVVLIANVIPF